MNLFSQIEDLIRSGAKVEMSTDADPFTCTEPATLTKRIHCFEAAGLGKAPFTYVGMVDQDIRYGNRVVSIKPGIEIETKPGGSCAYCGTYIVNMFNVRSADGNVFHVGCECIKKTGDEGLIRKVDAAVKKMRKAREIAKKKTQAEADRKLCESFPIGRLASKPHPHAYRAAQGETLYDWAKWMIENKLFKTLANVIRNESK